MIRTNRRDFFKGALALGAAAVAGANPRRAKADGARNGTHLRELGPIVTDWELRRQARLSGAKAGMYIDDVIWVFRDLTRQRPKSLFGNPLATPDTLGIANGASFGAALGKQLRFINPGEVLLDAEGKLREELFTGDGLHPCDKGYRLLGEHLKKDLGL